MKHITPIHLCLCGLLSSVSILFADTTTCLTNRFAYGPNIGWINAGGDGIHGLTVAQNVCAGYLYSANIGWISVGDGTPTNGIQYGNDTANDCGVNRDAAGHLTGHAYSANTGWLTFEQTNGLPTIDPFTGQMSGSVWSANLGWISLSNAYSSVRVLQVLDGADADGDGTPDWWEYQYYGATNAPGSEPDCDSDGDGMRNSAEQRAGTDPTSAGSVLAMGESHSSTNTTDQLVLTWPSVAGHRYSVLSCTNLLSGWTTEVSGLVATPPLNVHTAAVGRSSCFWRIKVE